jgi:prepilin-type N-terminal cleavage/methylation domain-containing protein
MNSALAKEQSAANRLAAAIILRVKGFTLTELLVVLAVLSLLAALVVARSVARQENVRLAQCIANLEQVNHAVLSFSHEHNDTLPAATPEVPGNVWWWYKEQVRSYAGLSGASAATDKVFACPDDRGYTDPIPFHLNSRFDFSSYVYNGVTMPGLPNIAGWPVSSVSKPKRTLLVMEWTAHAPLSWHKSKTGRSNMPFYRDAQSAVGFVDGHVSFSRIYYDGYNAAYTRDPLAGYDYQYSGK